MLLDLQEMFSGSVSAAGVTSGQALTATAISDNVIDLRNFRTGVTTPATVDEGILGCDMWLVVQVLTAAAGGDAAKTLTVSLESDTVVGLSSAPVVHYQSAATLGSALTAGATVVRTKLPSGDYKRYLGLRYTVSASFTSFTVQSFLTPDVQRNVIYPGAFTIDV